MRRVLGTRNASKETSLFAGPNNPTYEDELHALKLKTKLQTPSFFWHAATTLLPFPATFLDRFRHHTTATPAKESVHCLPYLKKAEHHKPVKASSSPSLGTVWKFCRHTLLTFLLAAFLFMTMDSTSADEKGSRAQDLQAGGVGHNTKVAEPAFNMQEEWIDLDRRLKEEEYDAQVEQAKHERQSKEAEYDAWVEEEDYSWWLEEEDYAWVEEEELLIHHELIMQALNDAWYAMDWEDEAWQTLKKAKNDRRGPGR